MKKHMASLSKLEDKSIDELNFSEVEEIKNARDALVALHGKEVESIEAMEVRGKAFDETGFTSLVKAVDKLIESLPSDDDLAARGQDRRTQWRQIPGVADIQSKGGHRGLGMNDDEWDIA